MTVLLTVALVTLAMSGVGPALTQPVVVWTIPSAGFRLSVGHLGIFVAGGNEARRYDFDGGLVWTKTVGNSTLNRAKGVAVGIDGLYVVGTAFVQKLDFNGKSVWIRPFEGTAHAVGVDATGVYVVGGPGVQVAPGPFFPPAGLGIIEKFDSRGNEIWARQLQAVNRSTLGYGISVSPKGVYLVQENYCVRGERCSPSSAPVDFIKAFDRDGNELWSMQSVSFGVSAGPTGIYTVGGSSFVSKYDFNGGLVWSVEEGPPDTIPIGVSADSSGVYVVGFHYSSFPGDAFIEHIDSKGVATWSLFFATSSAIGASTSARGIFVAGDDFIAEVCASPSCVHN